MANSDKIKSVISNVQTLMDLAVSMKDSELYPLSFFSSAFDLIQKVQNDFQALEAGQVEQFASQMKKHQDLIISIHRQMRNIENIPENPPQTENPPKKANPVTAAPVIPPKEAEKPVIRPEMEIRPAPEPLRQPEPEPLQEEEFQSAAVEDNTPRQPLSLNEVIGKKQLSDLRKAFSLNDRFHYQRELFGGSEDAMNRIIGELNSKLSLGESIAYLEEKLHWDLSDPAVNGFIKKLEIRFL